MTRGSSGRRVGLLALLLLSGCVPFALPPGKLSLGAGPQHHGPGFEGAGAASGSELSQQLRASVHPLGLARSLRGRQLDVGVGYSAEQGGSERSQALAGPFVELTYVPWHSAGRRGFRLGTSVSPLLLTTGPGTLGDGLDAGVDLRVELEWTSFSGLKDFSSREGESTPSRADDSVVLGVAYGEWSIGAWAAGGYRSSAGSDVWNAWFGISGRWPALAGVLCCLDPSD